jgi:hypothetical protein
MIVYIIIGVILVFILVKLLWDPLFGKKRMKALSWWAQVNGFMFSEKGDALPQDSQGEFQLFSQGHSRSMRNVLTGTFNKIPCMIFDYQYVTGGGKNSHVWRQTVIALQSAQGRLPGFALRPENLFDKIGDKIIHKDIDFPAYPDFSKRYYLRGENAESVRQIFTDQAVRYFEDHPGLSVEGSGARLIFYRQSKMVTVENIQDFLQQGFEVFSLFKGY